MGSIALNCFKAIEPLRGNSLFFTTRSPGDPDIHLINLGRMKGSELTLEPPSGFDAGTTELGIQRLNH